MQHLDNQMRRWTNNLQKEVKVDVQESFRLATTIKDEVSGLPENVRSEIIQFAGTEISLRDRLVELQAFQRWMDGANSLPNLPPEIVRAQMITQNYICFVYLGEACFKELRKCRLLKGSTSKKCCTFLTNNPIRAFRNALAHANWRYKDDFSGIEFWAWKGDNREEPLSLFEVSQDQLAFRQRRLGHSDDEVQRLRQRNLGVQCVLEFGEERHHIRLT